MKCDELKARTAYSIAMEEEDLESSGTTLVYLKSEADKVIAAKDEEIARLDDLAHAHNIELLRKENLIEEKDAEIARLKSIRKVHIESIESMCEGLKLDAKQICKTKRALWLARAKRSYAEAKFNHQTARRYEEHKERTIAKSFDAEVHKWKNVERKCRAKAEEYK